MRPDSIDDVNAAYLTALASKQKLQYQLRDALKAVETIQALIAEKTATVVELRAEVQRFMGKDVAA